MTIEEKPGPLSKIWSLLVGDNGGITHKDLERELSRNKFSDFLPWVTFDQESGSFQTLENRHGYLFEICPLTFLGGRDLKQLETFLSVTYPKRTQIQIILAPDHNVNRILDAYARNKQRKEPLLQKSIEQYTSFLRDGTKGMRCYHGIPVRNWRAFVCIKTVKPLSSEVLSIAEETLQLSLIHI